MNPRSLWAALTAGGTAAATGSGLGLLGLLIYSFLAEEKVVYLPFALMTVAFISVLLGGFKGGLAAGSAGWLHGGAVAAFYLFMVILLKILVFPAVSFGMATLVFAGTVLLAGCTGGILGINLKFMRRQRVRRYLRRS